MVQGKPTLKRILLGLDRATAGTATLMGNLSSRYDYQLQWELGRCNFDDSVGGLPNRKGL